MADYVIRIELPSETEESAMAGAGTASTGGKSDSNDGGFSLGAEKVVKKAAQMVSFATVKSTADQIINYKISTISLRTGATEYEQRASAIHSVISQTVGAGAALIGAGIAAGPAGVAVAAIGLIASGINKAIEISQKEDKLRLQESVENVSIGMQNVRAGVAGRRGSNQ